MKNFLRILVILSISFLSLFNVKAAENDDFVLEKIVPISFNEISLYFNSNLEEGDDVLREFRIFTTWDSLDELTVIETNLDETDKSILNLIFDVSALPGVEYELVIIDLNDVDWRNIESWIDWLGFFIMPLFFDEVIDEFIDDFENVIDNNIISKTDPEVPIKDSSNENSMLEGYLDASILDEVVENSTLDDDDDDDDVELNSALQNISWQNMDEDDIEKNTLSESGNVSVLPSTWTWHLFIIILSIILSLLFFTLKIKKYK